MAVNNLLYPPVRVPAEAANVRTSTVRFYDRREGESEEQYQLRIQTNDNRLRHLRCFGLGDNATNYQRWLEESPVYRKLIFDKLNIPPFIGPVVIEPKAAAIVYFYSIGRLLDQRLDIPGMRRALACAEFLMPMINRTSCTRGRS